MLKTNGARLPKMSDQSLIFGNSKVGNGQISSSPNIKNWNINDMDGNALINGKTDFIKLCFKSRLEQSSFWTTDNGIVFT